MAASSSLFSRLLQSLKKHKRTTVRRRCRPTLETLESRLAMAALVDTSGTGAAATLSSPTSLPALGLAPTFQLTGNSSTTYPSVFQNFPAPRDLSAGDAIGFDVFNNSSIIARLGLSIHQSDGSVRSVLKNIQPYSNVKLALPFNIRGHVLGLPFTESDVRWMDSNLTRVIPNKVTQLQFYLDRPGGNTTLTISNVRLLQHIPLDQPVMDILGQYTGRDWAGKAPDVDTLTQMIQNDIAQAQPRTIQPGRDEYGGLLNSTIDFGGTLPDGGTGHFATAQDTSGKWWLITPVGNPFFSVGVDAVVDTAETKVVGRGNLFDPATPVDSQGITDFYQQNIQRYNAIAGDGANWVERTTNRLTQWGFNTVGNWSDEALTQPNGLASRLPYTRTIVNKRLLSLPNSTYPPPSMVDFPETNVPVPTFYTQNGRWPFPDVFSQQFHDFITQDSVQVQTGVDANGSPTYRTEPGYFGTAEVARTASDPYAIGFFVDNEIRWNGEELGTSVAVARNGLNMVGSEVRARFIEQLATHYESVESLLQAWGATLSPTIATPNETPLSQLGDQKFIFPTTLNATAQADLNELLGVYADQYYRLVREGFKAHMPDTLYLGDRLLGGTAPAPVMEAAAKYVDVMSLNIYRQPQNLAAVDWSKYAAVGKPMLLSEFGYFGTGSGNFQGWNYSVDVTTQAERGVAYQRTMDLIANNPLFVGASFFDYVDAPATGRLDTNNYNWGIVSVLDLPWTDLTSRIETWNNSVYDKRLGIKLINNAPSIDNSVPTPTNPILEEDLNTFGTPVESLLAGVSDADNLAERGIAITYLSNADQGTWQYTIDGGVSWFNFRSLSAAAARLLPATGNFSRIRFLPNVDFSGTVQISFRAWDQTQGYAPNTFDISSDARVGGTSGFSAELHTSDLIVVDVNDAPRLSTATVAPLAKITEDQTASYGTPIYQLIAGINEVDLGAVRGLAIVGADTTNGFWQFTLDFGATWQTAPAISESSALLLPGLGNYSRLRFVPNADFNGTAQIRYYAWDQTQETAGAIVDLSDPARHGGTTAFSINSRFSTLTVLAANDAPVLNSAATMPLANVAFNQRTSYGSPIWMLLDGFSDVDAGSPRGVAITNVSTANGQWQYTLDNSVTWKAFPVVTSSAALLLPAQVNAARIRFIPNLNYFGPAQVTFFAWDQSSGAPGTQVNIAAPSSHGGTRAFSTAFATTGLNVKPGNYPPIVTLSSDVGYQLNAAPLYFANAATLADRDSGNFAGGYLRIAVTSGADASNYLGIGGSFSVVTVNGTRQVFLNDQQVGTLFSDGLGLRNLRINFTANATPAIAEQLLRSITFRTKGSNSTDPATRTLSVVVSDGSLNGLSAASTQRILVSR